MAGTSAGVAVGAGACVGPETGVDVSMMLSSTIHSVVSLSADESILSLRGDEWTVTVRNLSELVDHTERPIPPFLPMRV